MATICRDAYGRRYYCTSRWNSWGRWVLLGVIIVAFILFFFMCSCITARRRRKAGQRPIYGTGWAYQQPPPQQSQPYGQQGNPNWGNPNWGNPTQSRPGENMGYYGNATGPTPPANAYWPSPPGPPPNK